MDGIFLINKEVGPTSFDIIRDFRDIVNVKKVGHCGTLDPLAEGLLILVLGKATKLVEYIHQLDKEYTAHIKLGEQTTTDDGEGDVIMEGEYEDIKYEDVIVVLKSFMGEILQNPPAFSAVTEKGRKAYKRARKGDLTLPEIRCVFIEDIIFKSFNPPFITIDVICRSGTYIRSLARDIGTKLGCGAHLSSLVRRRIGPYLLENSYSLNDVTGKTGQFSDQLGGAFIDLNNTLTWMKKLVVDDDDWRELSFGRSIVNDANGEQDDIYRLITTSGELVGLGGVSHGKLHPRKMLRLHSDV